MSSSFAPFVIPTLSRRRDLRDYAALAGDEALRRVNGRKDEMGIALGESESRRRHPPRAAERDLGYSDAVVTRTVDTQIAELRKKLEPDPANPVHFLTVRKVGYRLAT